MMGAVLRSQWMAGVAVIVGAVLSGPASAAFFTLTDPVAIDGDGVTGTIDPVLSPPGTSGTILLFDGIIDFNTTDVVVVDVTVDTGSIELFEFGASPGAVLNPVGAGAFDDFGKQAPGNVTAVPLDPILFTGGVGSFYYTSANLDATSVRLFVTYDPGVMEIGDGANFMIRAPGFTSFTEQGTIVPEPSTLLLLCAGLAVFGGRGLRSRAR